IHHFIELFGYFLEVIIVAKMSSGRELPLPDLRKHRPEFSHRSRGAVRDDQSERAEEEREQDREQSQSEDRLPKLDQENVLRMVRERRELHQRDVAFAHVSVEQGREKPGQQQSLKGENGNVPELVAGIDEQV